MLFKEDVSNHHPVGHQAVQYQYSCLSRSHRARLALSVLPRGDLSSQPGGIMSEKLPRFASPDCRRGLGGDGGGVEGWGEGVVLSEV